VDTFATLKNIGEGASISFKAVMSDGDKMLDTFTVIKVTSTDEMVRINAESAKGRYWLYAKKDGEEHVKLLTKNLETLYSSSFILNP